MSSFLGSIILEFSIDVEFCSNGDNTAGAIFALFTDSAIFDLCSKSSRFAVWTRSGRIIIVFKGHFSIIFVFHAHFRDVGSKLVQRYGDF